MPGDDVNFLGLSFVKFSYLGHSKQRSRMDGK